MTTGQGFAMKIELAKLMARHGIAPPAFTPLPSAAPSSCPVLISGIASSCNIDNERMKFRPWALSFLPWRPPPLLFRHKEPAGEITHIWRDAQGRVIISACVDHPPAQQCQGLSVAATIEKYELCDVDDPVKFHAVILQARLDEISLTPSPCDPAALVTSRIPANPSNEFYDLVAQGINKAIEIVECLRVINREWQPPEMRKLPKPRLAVEPHRQTPFGQLVQQLERNHHAG